MGNAFDRLLEAVASMPPAVLVVAAVVFVVVFLKVLGKLLEE